MGLTCTKMGKTKLITKAPEPGTTPPLPGPTPPLPDPNTTPVYGATSKAPTYDRQPSAVSSDGDILWEELEKELQENNLSNLRDDLYQNPEQFLLTNILMSIQFFKNFERDKEDSFSKKDAQKKSFDDKLTDMKKNVIIPRGIFSKIFECVAYRDDNGVSLLPLNSEDCILFFNNVETYRNEEFQRLQDGSMQYFQVDTTLYRVCIEAAKNAGYVKVMCVDDHLTRRSSIIPRASSDEIILPESTQASSDLISEETNIRIPEKVKPLSTDIGVNIDKDNYVTKMKHRQFPTEATNSAKGLLNPPRNVLVVDDGIYGYAYINPTPLNEFNRQESRGSLINNSCFRYSQVQIEDDLDELLTVGEKEKRCYLSSNGIMDLFQNQFYEISCKIEKRNLTNSALVLKPDVICREEVEDSAKEMMWRFTPSIEVGFWPDEGFEWFLRPRNIMRCRRTGMKYQWPSPEMTSAVRQLGCNIVPTGFCHPKKEIKNPESDLEWELRFAKAEIFITRNLHHPKLRVYIFMVLLYKEYLEQFSGITERHIRYLFYWLVESSPADWIEENIGEKFMLFIKRLELHLKKQRLPNYFLKNCNMFANIPNHKLRAAQEKVHRILENPVFYLLNCLSNLQVDKNFYPTLDIQKLYLILTTENQLAMINPALLGSVVDDNDRKSEKTKQTSKTMQQGDNYQQHMRKFRSQLEVQASKNSSSKEEEPKIDVNAKVMPFDEPRRKLLLEFFISHFIKMSQKSNVFRNHGQGTLYLLHAENLLTLLAEMGYDDNSNKTQLLKKDILNLRDVKSPNHIKDYWSISFGHRQLYSRSSHNSLSLPSIPTGQPSPIPGTMRPESKGEADKDKNIEKKGKLGEEKGKSLKSKSNATKVPKKQKNAIEGKYQESKPKKSTDGSYTPRKEDMRVKESRKGSDRKSKIQEKLQEKPDDNKTEVSSITLLEFPCEESGDFDTSTRL